MNVLKLNNMSLFSLWTFPILYEGHKWLVCCFDVTESRNVSESQNLTDVHRTADIPISVGSDIIWNVIGVHDSIGFNREHSGGEENHNLITRNLCNKRNISSTFFNKIIPDLDNNAQTGTESDSRT